MALLAPSLVDPMGEIHARDLKKTFEVAAKEVSRENSVDAGEASIDLQR